MLALVGWNHDHQRPPPLDHAGFTDPRVPLLVVAGTPAAARSEILHKAHAALEQGQKRKIVGLDGACALLAVSREADELLLAIDYLGLRPLYYVRHDGALWCATALRALAMLPRLAVRVDRDYLIRQNLRVGRTYSDAQISGITRIRGNTLHRVGPEGPPTIIAGDPVEPLAPGARARPDDELVAALNSRVLERVDRIPRDQPLALWLSGGLDSRWISAALSSSGRAHDLLIVGPEEDEDRALALQYSAARGHRGLVGDPTAPETARYLSESNWHLDATASLFEQMVGGLWPFLRQESPRLVHGYFWDLLKWTPPVLPQRLSELGFDRLRLRSGTEPVSPFRQITGDFMEKSRMKALFPDAPGLLDEGLRRLEPQLATDHPAHAALRLSIDGGPLEPFLTWGRMGCALGGSEFPLADTELVRLILETMSLPRAKRESLQARCVVALDPRCAGRVPVHPVNVRPDVLARGGPVRSGHAVRNPAWLLGRIRQRSRMHRAPARMQLLGSPPFRMWLSRLLDHDSAAAEAFGHQNMSRFMESALAPPFSWRAVSLLYELAALELFVRSFRRAQRGSTQPWVGLGPE